MQSIIRQFIDLDDLAGIVSKMMNRNILAHNPNTPLEFIDFESLSDRVQYTLCIRNKHLNKQFVLNHIDDIFMESWYCISWRDLIDLEIFNLLHKDIQNRLLELHEHLNLKLPTKVIIDHVSVYEWSWLSRYSLTEDEIEYMLSIQYPKEKIYTVYRTLVECQRLTPKHLDIMKTQYPKTTARIIDDYY
jgi:hypothetical protein